MTNWWPKFDNKIVASAGGWPGAAPGGLPVSVSSHHV